MKILMRESGKENALIHFKSRSLLDLTGFHTAFAIINLSIVLLLCRCRCKFHCFTKNFLFHPFSTETLVRRSDALCAMNNFLIHGDDRG